MSSSIGGRFWLAICRPASLAPAEQFRSQPASAQGPGGFYNKFGVQVASSPDGPFAEKMANPTGLDWSTPNSGVLVINEFGYRKEAAPDQLATWVRAAAIVNTSRYVDFEFGGRSTGNYAAYVLADQQFVQLPR